MPFEIIEKDNEVQVTLDCFVFKTPTTAKEVEDLMRYLEAFIQNLKEKENLF